VEFNLEDGCLKMYESESKWTEMLC